MDLHGRHHPADVADIGRANQRIALGVDRHQEIGERPVGRLHADRIIDRSDVLVGQGRADPAGEILVGIVEMRRAEILHDPVQRLFQRRVGQDVGDRGDDLHLDLGLGHQRRALRDLVYALDQLVHAGQVAGADRVAHPGMGLHHVRRDAAGIEQRIVHAGIARHVLAHVVDADIHQFHRVERAAAELGGSCGMRGAAGEDEVGAGVGERRRHRHLPEAVRMPGDGDVGVLEGATAHHEGFCRAAFLGGTAVIAHTARHLVGGQPVLHGGCGKQRGGAEQIVAAAMTMAAALHRAMFGDSGLLAEAGQRVIFAEEGDHGTAFAPFADHRGRNVGDVLGDAEPLMTQLGQMFGGGARFGVADLGHRPDPVAQFDETRLDGVDATPDITTVVHLLRSLN